VIKVAFDMRDPVRSGIARVARSMARAFIENNATGPYDISLCGPADGLASLETRHWSRPSPRTVEWNAGRFSIGAEREWPRVSRATGDAVWYFPHWDMPWRAHPRRSIVLISDVIPLVVAGATTPLRREIARRWIRRSGRIASRLTVSTEFTKNEVLQLWPDLAAKVSVLPLGVDGGFFQSPPPLPASFEAIASRGPFMVSVGNRKPHKNLVRGLDVLARLRELHWIVVGENFPGWEAVTERARSLGVADRMHVFDGQPDSTVHGLYARSVCLFFPSRSEGFGLPILEALASGTNVVAGAAGSSIEVLNGHGAVCDLDDGDAFAEAVRRVMQSGRPGPAARQYAESCSWRRSARRLEQLIREL
jgi:glycosyltransferase involved in cell wall biosynthesis